MKKLIVLTFCVFAYAATVKAQVLTPVHWAFGAKKISKTEAVVFFKASIDPGWHIYSQFVADGGPVKTSFTFKTSPDYTTDGTTAEPKPITRTEKVFNNMEVGYFENSVIFQQKVKLKKGQATVSGTLEYMTCNDHQCLPPDDIDFNIPVK